MDLSQERTAHPQQRPGVGGVDLQANAGGFGGRGMRGFCSNYL